MYHQTKREIPTIYKISINLNYNLKKDNNIVFENEILEQSTYNNIDDKFELLKYEENIIEKSIRKIC